MSPNVTLAGRSNERNLIGVGVRFSISYTQQLSEAGSVLNSNDDDGDRPITRSLDSVESRIEPPPYDPIEALAALMDLRGSVELARFMTEEAEPTEAEPSHPAAVLAMVAKVIEDVRSRTEFSFENAFRPRFRLPTARRAWGILKRAGVVEPAHALTKRQRNAALKTATRMLWAPFGEFLETRLKRARFALKDLRDELGGPLAGLGPRSAQLAKMDAALRAATSHEVDQLYRRVGHTSELHFAEALKSALDELPNLADREGFELGFCEEGWLGQVFSEGHRMIHGVIEHEISQIQSLTHSAIKLHHEQS